MASDHYTRIYNVVKRIPRGRVASYGQIAELAGIPRHARQVGYALHHLSDDSGVPWQRVLNAAGEIAKRAYPEDARPGPQAASGDAPVSLRLGFQGDWAQIR